MIMALRCALMTVEPATVPWYSVALVTVTAIGSAAVAAANIGTGYAVPQVPALLGYVFAVALHLGAAQAAWRTARSTDPRARNVARYTIKGAGILLFIAGATAALLRYQSDGIATILPGMVLIGTVCAAGPILMLMIFFPNRHATT